MRRLSFLLGLGPELWLVRYKSSLGDFSGVRQFPRELHVGTDRSKCVGIEVEDAQRVICQLFIDHFEIEIDIVGQNAPYPLR